MSLFEIMDEISEKQVMKTETGDSRIFGVVVGIVAKNYNKDMPGRVCVTVPVRDSEANELKWARVACMSGGEKWGQYFLPEIGDQVLLVFENGNIEKPYVIGCIPKDDSQFTARTADEKNQIKMIQTRNGSRLEFFDNREGDGSRDRISIITASEVFSLVLDNEKKTVTLSDKEGKNSVTMNSGNGGVDLKAENTVNIKAGENVSVKCDGKKGNLEIRASKISITGSSGIEMKSDAAVKVSGTSIEETAKTGMKLSSGATMKIEGTIINIG